MLVLALVSIRWEPNKNTKIGVEVVESESALESEEGKQGAIHCKEGLARESGPTRTHSLDQYR